MPQQAWSKKRERQYEHIKEGSRTAAAARTRPRRSRPGPSTRSGPARASPSRPAGRRPQDISSGRRGGLRSHRGPGGRTRDQLYEEAKQKNIKGRSKMSKAELEKAVGR